jgi:hypothetical protein
MTITVTQGYYDTASDTYWGSNSDDWSDLANSPYQTWANWRLWTTNAQSVILTIDDDLGSSAVRAPICQFQATGECSLQLKYSTTGAFAGEETTINFAPGTEYTYGTARYYRWTVTVATTSYVPVPSLSGVSTSYLSSELRSEFYSNVDTSTLSGSASARTVPTLLGSVSNVQLTTKVATAWTDRAYSLPDAYADPTQIAPIAGVVQLNPLQIRLVDHFSVPVDGTVDIQIQGLGKITQFTTDQGITLL